MGPQIELLERLVIAIEGCPWWSDYDIAWTFYCQSNYMNKRLAQLLQRIKSTKVFIGFDGVNDEIQKTNGLGTSKKNHLSAARICGEHGIQIQAASVVGLKGETPGSLEESYQFFKELKQYDGLVERINSAIFFIIPGTLAWAMLAEKEPQIREMDLLHTTELRDMWIEHFCPDVNLAMLEDYANKIDALSPGPHASMGYKSLLLGK